MYFFTFSYNVLQLSASAFWRSTGWTMLWFVFRIAIKKERLDIFQRILPYSVDWTIPILMEYDLIQIAVSAN